ncbi:UTRA domain-containing protein [Clostridiaceae bacterium DONG20-135]|uniref:UTRA domain-containing protein n=1 Tax=Copranaerobaculum intestinale TaxID=2692629 RepID=A0A6N8U743_9FIRM|nr:GntR family transcriptional regulator [Copranaerobaculum intestinale]MXQ72339.1 UTRA domain-containing protein [Copranaerobaculum intestinale]
MNNYAQPLYLQLKDSIIEKIHRGEYCTGMKIPSEREMAKLYGINRMTIRRTVGLLIEEGYLVSVHGKGTYVTKANSNRIELGMNSSTRLSVDIRMGGMDPRKEIISFQKIAAIPRLQELFPQYDTFYELVRLLFANNEPYALQKAYFPYLLFPDADRYDFKDGSLYDYMDTKKKMPVHISSRLWVEPLDADKARYLNMREGERAFVFAYQGHSEQQELVEYTLSYNRPEYTSYKYVSIR